MNVVLGIDTIAPSPNFLTLELNQNTPKDQIHSQYMYQYMF